MAYAVYSFVSQYTDTGQIGIYLGTREDNLADALAITAEQIADIAAGNLPDARARAGEGEPQGPHPALDGVDVDAHEPARQVADHRLGAAVARPDRRRDRRRRRRRRSCELAAALLAPEQLSAACIGPSEERFLEALERDHARPRSRGVKVLLNGRARQGRHGARARRSRRRATGSSTRSPRPTRWSTSRGPTPSLGKRARGGRRPACRASSARPAGTRARSRDAPVAGLLRAELRDRRRADDALRRRGRAHLDARRDHRAAPRGEARRAVGHGEADRRADGRRRADPLGAAARAERPPGGDPRRARASC